MKDLKNLSSLVEAARSGDEDAFVALYNCFSKHIYYNACKLTGNESDAKDILQEVMLRLYSQLSSIQNPRGLPLYLYRTTYRLCADLWRQRQKDDLFADDEQAEKILGAEKRREFLPEEYAEIQEQRDYLICVLDELNPSYKAVLLMFYYDGLTLKEIAKVLQINVNTARVKLQNSRESLKRKLEKDRQKRGVSLHAMSVPVLTRIMQHNADSLFTETVNAQVWENIAQQLGFSTATAAAATAATAATAPGIAAAGTVRAPIVALLLTTGAVTASLWGIGLIGPQEEKGDISPSDSPIDSAISSRQEQGVDIENQETPLFGGLHTFGDRYAPDTFAEPHTPPVSTEVPSSEEASGWRDEQGGGSTASGSTAVIQCENNMLYYPIGTEITLEQLFSDAVITGVSPADVQVTGLDEINIWQPNKYGVLLTVPTDSAGGYTLAIAVIIQP